MIRDKNDDWALYAKSVLDRTHLALANIAEGYQKLLQPSADYLGSLLGIEEKAVYVLHVAIKRTVVVLVSNRLLILRWHEIPCR